MHALFLSVMIACGGGEKKAEAPPAEPPKPAAPAPAPVAAPTPPPAPAAAAPTGPYAPDDLAKAAYDKAKAAGADKTAANPKAGDAAAIAAGKATYDTKCASCHGTTGAADTPVGQALPQKPANFHDKSRWDYTNVGIKHWVLMNGIQGTGMAPLGLTEAQAWETLAYIESEFVGK